MFVERIQNVEFISKEKHKKCVREERKKKLIRCKNVIKGQKNGNGNVHEQHQPTKKNERTPNS